MVGGKNSKSRSISLRARESGVLDPSPVIKKW